MVESLGSNFELARFSGEAPLMPLPNVVFFPKTLLPLYIFESRYKRMVKDVLQNERMVCMALLKNEDERNQFGQPPIHDVGTLGYVEEYEELNEGRYNIILNGISKVNISEIYSNKPYRQGHLEIAPDIVADWKEEEERENILQQFRKIADAFEGDIPYQEIEQSNVSLEVLTNLLATWLPIPEIEKQKLLEVSDLAIRSEIVREFLRQEIDDYSFLEDMNIRLPNDPRWN